MAVAVRADGVGGGARRTPTSAATPQETVADRKKIELQAVGDKRDIAVKTTGLAMALARSGRLDEAGYTTRFMAGRALPMARSS